MIQKFSHQKLCAFINIAQFLTQQVLPHLDQMQPLEIGQCIK
jgi:hypothetical protein